MGKLYRVYKIIVIYGLNNFVKIGKLLPSVKPGLSLGNNGGTVSKGEGFVVVSSLAAGVVDVAVVEVVVVVVVVVDVAEVEIVEGMGLEKIPPNC